MIRNNFLTSQLLFTVVNKISDFDSCFVKFSYVEIFSFVSSAEISSDVDVVVFNNPADDV